MPLQAAHWTVISKEGKIVRGKKPAVSPYERRRWLEKLENGQGITKIAKVARRDIRVVKRHIELAREERQMGQAQRDFLLGRLEQHQEDLLREVERIRQVITQFEPRPLDLVDSQQRKVHEALIEHIRHRPLWRMLEAYQSAVREYEQWRDSIRRELADKETELVSTLPREVDLYPWTPKLVEVLEAGALEASSQRSYVENRDNEGAYRPSWQGLGLTQSCVTPASRSALLEAHGRLLSHAERYQPTFQGYRQRIRELGNELVEELEVLLVKRVVPGRCRYCPF